MKLGGASPLAGAETVIYVPAANVQAAMKIICVNRTNGVVQVRAAHRPIAGGPTTTADYLSFDESIPAHDSRVSKVFDVVNPEDVTVQSDTAGVTFVANGIERAV